jgi:hypothetical protein
VQLKHFQTADVLRMVDGGYSLQEALHATLRNTMGDGSLPPVSAVADEVLAILAARRAGGQ